MANIKHVHLAEQIGVREYGDWDPAVSGMQISVPAYTFKVGGADFELTESWDFTASTRPEETQVMAYLVRNIGSSDIEVLVDEIVIDGSEVPYMFGDGAYEMLAKLWYAKIPGDSSDLGSQEIMAFRTLPVEPDEEEAD